MRRALHGPFLAVLCLAAPMPAHAAVMTWECQLLHEGVVPAYYQPASVARMLPQSRSADRVTYEAAFWLIGAGRRATALPLLDRVARSRPEAYLARASRRLAAHLRGCPAGPLLRTWRTRGPADSPRVHRLPSADPVFRLIAAGERTAGRPPGGAGP